ncbi:hypothetical protein GQ55_4G205200 [Panicum hallii var. hallii]|uniref:Uncharacterized protein n=1 Tax=Panicum hallii var. hallii TaxID=1504633 RepID=A0A2T7DZ63_9POAL|nr:hypothetical protein GQ55_4G205200 [Panicum hallii var. hallii]
MADPSNAFWDQEGHFHTNALHWEGFPRLLWESLSLFHYTEPPQYDGVEYREEGVLRCRVKMIIPQHPFRSSWHPIEVEVVGYRLVDTLETAALEAIKLFCNQHPTEVAAYPIGLFPTIDPGNLEWNFRTEHLGHMLGDLAEETVRSITRFMDVQHNYQILLRHSMNQLTCAAQGHYRNTDRQVTQIVELQALVTQKDEIIAARDETILHREDQINESDHIITQRDTVIEFLQAQIHDLILEADDAQAHLEELQQQPILPAVPIMPEEEEEEEDPEEIEGVSEIDSEHGDPVLSPYHSPSGSQSSVGNFNDF